MEPNDKQGFEEERFEVPVNPGLLCSICQDVLRNPRACQNKEHPFCYACISKHLEYSPRCPECREHLTPETLKNPPRFLMDFLSNLKINCDYKDRGCLDYIRLENLQNHVNKCDFQPVVCDRCGMVVNRKDKNNQDCREHQNPETLKVRNTDGKKTSENNEKPKCHDCGYVKRRQEKMRVGIDLMRENQDQIRAKQNQTNTALDRVEAQMTEIERKHDVMNGKVDQLHENVNQIKQAQEEIKIDQEAFKAEMRQQFQTVTDMLNQLLQRTNRNIRPQPINQGYRVFSADNNTEVIIMGGWNAPGRDTILNTVEIVNMTEGRSAQLPSMNHPRVESASCVYNNDVIMTGGYDGRVCIESIEILSMGQRPLQWRMFDGKLPASLSSHCVVIYKDKLITIGGMNSTENKTSNAIHEISLFPPYTSKRIFKMNQARRNHAAQLVDGLLFVLGGTHTGLSTDSTDTVMSYDIDLKERKRCESLPYRVCGMSTVTWGSNIIIIGGADKNDRVLNSVIMYETVSGGSKQLPSMLYCRYGSSAVIVDGIIYVMGGWNQEQGYLNSIECLTIGNDFWIELPGMRERRRLASAVVKPKQH